MSIQLDTTISPQPPLPISNFTSEIPASAWLTSDSYTLDKGRVILSKARRGADWAVVGNAANGIVLDQVGGLDVFRQHSSGAALAAAGAIMNASAWSLVAICHRKTAVGVRNLAGMCGPGGSDRFSIDDIGDNQLRIEHGAGERLTIAQPATSGWRMVIMSFSASTLRGRVNLGPISTIAATALTGPLTPVALAEDVVPATGGTAFTGSIGDVMAFDGLDLLDGQNAGILTKIEGYALRTYGIS